MSERYPPYLFGGTPISSWERNFMSLENLRPRGLHSYGTDDLRSRQYQALHTDDYRGRTRNWASMSEGSAMSAGGGDSSKTNLIVNYLPQTMTEKDLYAMFMTVGPIESCRVMKDFKTGYSYGFGFVNFTREEDASRAIETFNGYQLRSKRLKVSYARPSGEDIKDTNLYVTNLPRAITEEQLETIFGKYGRIVQKHILRDKNNGLPRGVAFVRYDKREEAHEAIAALNNVIPEGGTEPLCVKVAEEHGKQKAAYYAGWAAGFHHNRGDMSWGCNGCMSDPWDAYGFDGPPTPRTPCHRPGACRPPLAPKPRPRPIRNPPWIACEERFKGQRCRNGPTPYW